VRPSVPSAGLYLRELAAQLCKQGKRGDVLLSRADT